MCKISLGLVKHLIKWNTPDFNRISNSIGITLVGGAPVNICFIHMLTCSHGHIDGLAWYCGSSSADALELLQSCAVPPMSVRKLFYTYVDMFSWSY